MRGRYRNWHVGKLPYSVRWYRANKRQRLLVSGNRISSLLYKADFRVRRITKTARKSTVRAIKGEMHQPVDAGKRGNLAARLLARRTAFRALLALPEGAIYYIYKEHK